jgi:hypothetical protein
MRPPRSLFIVALVLALAVPAALTRQAALWRARAESSAGTPAD